MKNPDGFDNGGWRRTKKIETLDELLCALSPQHWGVSAELAFMGRQGTGGWVTADSKRDKAYLNIASDHNYYVDEKIYDVTPEVAAEAINRHFVSGKPKWGYTSKHEWQINDEGRAAAREARRRFDESERTQKIVAIEDHDRGDEG